MDPPLSFDTMFGFVTRFDDISDGNNDMSIFEYLPVSQHFPLITPLAPTTHIYDVDDVGDTDDPLGGLGCMLAQLDDLGKERAIYYLSKRMLEYECRYIMIERLCLALV